MALSSARVVLVDRRRRLNVNYGRRFSQRTAVDQTTLADRRIRHFGHLLIIFTGEMTFTSKHLKKTIFGNRTREMCVQVENLQFSSL